MKAWTTKNGNKIYELLNGRSNVYLIIYKDHNILIDTGKSSSYKKLKTKIQQILPEGSTINFLILTHTHFDHCQNAKKIQDLHSCKIIMHKNEMEYAKQGYTPIPGGTNIITRLISNIGRKIGPKIAGYQSFSPDVVFEKEMDLYKYEINIKLIETKGHSAGSNSIIVDNEIALVGDTLFGILPNSVYPPFADDIYDLIKSWNKLLNTDCNLFLPGHGRSVTRLLLKKQYYKHK